MSIKICKYMKKLYDLNLIASYDGNISYKPKNKDIIYLSPASVPKYNLKSKMINKVKIVNIQEDYNKFNLETHKNSKLTNSIYNSDTKLYYSTQKNKKYKPTGEIGIHINVINTLHKYFDKDIIVIHCHPPNILAFMGLEENYYNELSKLHLLFPELPEFIKIAPNVKHLNARTNTLATAVNNNLIEPFNIVGLHNHGIVCYAHSFEKCLNIVNTLDYYALIALKYLSFNLKLNTIKYN